MKRQVPSLWKMTRRTMMACLLLLAIWQPAGAQTALSQGDVLCTGFNSSVDASNNKYYQFVLLTNITSGTSFKISGNTFNSSTSSASGSATAIVRGGIFKWTSTSSMSAGSIINITSNTAGSSVSASAGSVAALPSSCGCASGGFYANLNTGGKVLVYYSPSGDGTGTGQDFTGSTGTVTFKGTVLSLTGYQGTTSFTDFLTSGSDINVPYCPSDVSSKVFITGSARGGYYSGSRSFSSASAARTAILNSANWTGSTSTTGTGSFSGGAFTFGTTPAFSGTTTTLNACSAGTSVSINSILAITDGTASGTVDTFKIITSPVHGSMGGFPTTTTTASGGAATPSGLSYSPTSGYTGTDSFRVQVVNSSGNSVSRTIVVTVNASPNVGTMYTVQDSFCATAAWPYVARGGSTGGVWSSSNTAIATVANTGDTVATVTGIYSASTITASGGVATISYTVSTATCGSAVGTKLVYIRSFSDTGSVITPARGTIICTGATFNGTSNSFTYGLPRYLGVRYGATWTTQNSSIASVNASTGVIYGQSAGTVNITYTTAPGGCGSFRSVRNITIQTSPNAGTITGTTTMCVGASNTLTSSGTAGGTWTSSNTSVASVDASSGAVTGVGSGTATITYAVTSVSCGSANATTTVTINTAPSAGTVSGTSPICVGGSATYSATGATGGSWSSSNTAVASVNSSTGAVTGVGAGSANITYSVSNACGSNTASQSVTINAAASAGTVTGASSVCQGASTTFSSTGTGGSWSSSNTSVASVNPSTGAVYGVAAGSATISYTVSGTCGAGSATAALTVNPAPSAGTVSGTSPLCTGASATYTSSGTAGGSWSSSNTSVASVNSSTGAVYGIGAGSATISYSVTGTCGTNIATQGVTINTAASAGTITGSSSVCQGASTTLSTTGTGGTWSSSNTSVASVNSASGAVYGVTSGSATISYVVTGACGAGTATAAITVNPLPNAGTTSGATSVCTGVTTTLTNSGTTGGSWASSDNSRATVAGGIVWGVAAGSVTISYTVTNGCGTDIATHAMTVNTTPSAGSISGSSSVCEGASTTLSTTGTGGTWSSSNTSVASVNASGSVYGVAAGSATITYTVTTACGTATATQGITVNPLPNAGSISGSTSVCAGSNTTLSTTGTGGTWSSTNTGVASVSTSGVVYGVSAGSATISYTVTNTCGTVAATTSFTVNPLPNAGSISGASSVCQGANTTLTTTGTGGSWSSSASSIASVNAAGSVHGVAAGSATITYAASNSCGTDYATQSFTVNPLPVAGTISGTTSVCAGSNTTLSTTGTGGTWSSTNTGVASVSTSGVVYGVSAGSATISYTVTNTCGTVAATTSFTVNPLPNAGSISGASSVCEGANTTLTTTSTGGSWSSSNASVASVNTAGSVHGVAAGSATITYAASNSCGTDYATQSFTVNPLPVAGAISGTTTVCAGSNTALFTTGSGGTWSSTNTGVASVDASGVVTGISAGSATISYTVSGTCGTVAATQSVTVNPLPNAGSISGASSVCAGANTTLTTTGTGGSWSSSAASIASVNAAGSVRGVAAGSATITYSVTNGCGTDYTTQSITVNPLPVAGTVSGAASICVASNTTFSTTGTGGTWSSSNTGVATVDPSTGVVTGVAASTATITYSVTTACGTATATRGINVTSTPNPGTISGTPSACVGSGATLSTTGTGGTWSSTAPTVATVSGSGVVTAVSAGTATISYTVTSGCGVAAATQLFTANALPFAGTISGASSVCPAANITLTTTGTGGAWSSANTARATVSATGTVTGVAAGTVLISYTATTAFCGSATATKSITVNPLPNAGAIVCRPTSGLGSIGVGSAIPVSTTGVGGLWRLSDSTIARLDTTNTLTGLREGNVTISYSVVNTCGTDVATKSIRVKGLYFFNGYQQNISVCSNTITYALNVQLQTYDATAGRTIRWSVGASPAHGTLLFSGSATSVVGLIAPLTANYTPTGGYVGIDSFTVYASDSFGRDTAKVYVNVRDIPAMPTITGPNDVCSGSSITLTGAPSGGTWLSNGSSKITFTSTGVVTGTSGSGAPVMYYRVTDAYGCTNTANYPITVSIPGSTFGISASGSSIICPGGTLTLTHPTPGGTWTSQFPAIATVSAGTVTGISGGRDTIFYTLVNACGSISAYFQITVSGPTIPVIGGSGAPICVGATVNLTGNAGATWSHTSPAIATLTSTGVVTGRSAGIDTVKLSLVNACGLTGVATRIVNVQNPPNSGVISGPATVVVANNINLTTTGSGGAWTSVSPSVAVIGGTGFLRGVAAGIDTIKYTSTNGCGTSVSRYVVTVTAHRGEINGTVTNDPTASIKLYPNPTNSIVTLEITGATDNAEITITDVSGKVISNTTTTDRTLDINMSNVPQGIYLVTVRTNGNVYREKVVVE